MDASSPTLGVVIKVNGCVIEDASWLRAEDSSHISVAEFDAVIIGLNLSLAWWMKKTDLLTHPQSIAGYLTVLREEPD